MTDLSLEVHRRPPTREATEDRGAKRIPDFSLDVDRRAPRLRSNARVDVAAEDVNNFETLS